MCFIFSYRRVIYVLIYIICFLFRYWTFGDNSVRIINITLIPLTLYHTIKSLGVASL